MNERKQSHHEYFNPTQTKQTQTAEELLALIKIFMYNNTLNPADFITLTKIIKQLNTQKDKLPSKVLRALRNKFDNVKEQYQR